MSGIYEDNEIYFGEEDKQTELYDPENRENVEFDKFSGFGKSAKNSRRTWSSDNPFLTQTKAEDILGNDFYSGVLEIKDDIQLDRTLFAYFNRCSLANQVLAKYNFS